MSLNELPTMTNFFGLDLQVGTYIIAALGIVHPMAYGCSFFIPLTYIMMTIWILLLLYFSASFVLMFGVVQGNTSFYLIYIWIALVFVFFMILLMIMYIYVFISREQHCRALAAFFGLLWYAMNIYFILVVNSQRRILTRSGGNDKHAPEVRSAPAVPELLSEDYLKPRYY